MRKFILSLFVLALLCGCQQAKETTTSANDSVTVESTDEEYYKMINVGASELREDYYNKFSRTDDIVTIGRGLQLLSSEHFSIDSYYMSEGQYLSANNRKELSTYYRSDDHPYSLEPTKTEEIQGESGMDMVEDVHEQDYYKKSGNQYKLAGVSFAIIVDPKKTDDQTSVSITDSTLKSYAQKCIQKLYEDIQEMDDLEAIRDVPILIAIFKRTDSSKSSIDGNYILKCYCDGSVGSIKSVNHKNVLFTSDEAKSLDPTTYSEFETIKSNIKDASLEASSIVGQAKYIDDEIQSMKIEAHINIKTYTEILYLTSVIENNISTRFSKSFTIKVYVYSQDGLQATIIKSSGKDAQTTYVN